MALIPYDVKIEFSPLRMKKGDERPTHMLINVKNLDKEENLTSVVIEIPREMGFDKIGTVSRKEIRIGTLKPNENKDFKIELFPNHRAEQGTYDVKVKANKHYRGYSHIINTAEKNISLRIV
jgi:uncharacterized membrane protein